MYQELFFAENHMAESIHRNRSLLEMLGPENLQKKLDELGIKPDAVFVAKKQYNGGGIVLFEGTQFTVTEIDIKGSVSFNWSFNGVDGRWVAYMSPFVEQVESGVLGLAQQ